MEYLMTKSRFLPQAVLLASFFLTFQVRADVSGLTADYLQVNASIVTQMNILKANAGSCGFIAVRLPMP